MQIDKIEQKEKRHRMVENSFTKKNDIQGSIIEFKDNRSSTKRQNKIIQCINNNEKLALNNMSPVKENTKHSLIIQRLVKTMGGDWDTTVYNPTNAGGQKGAEINLVFTPGDFVDATKIGLTQSVKTYKNSAEYAINANPTNQGRMIPQVEFTLDHLGEPTSGMKIDRLSSANNPIYGGQNLNAGQTLANTNMNSGNILTPHHQLGFRHDNGLHLQNASLHDSPKLNAADNNSGQVFETSALAIEGTQMDTFYGSVKWGWRTDNVGNHTTIPLQVISHGAPTPAFKRAAEIWKDTDSSLGVKGKELPTQNIICTYFETEFKSEYLEDLYIVGNLPEIGSWNVDRAAKLHYANPSKWQGYVGFNANKANQNLEYKYIVKQNNLLKRWEGGNNRQPGQLPVGGIKNYHDKFNYD